MDDVPGAPGIVMYCSDAGEPHSWLTLSAAPGSHGILAVANALLSVVAMAELEWQRWLA